MTASRAERTPCRTARFGWLAVAALTLSTWVGAAPAGAQVGAPKPLIPSLGAPAPAKPETGGAAAPAEALPPTQPTVPASGTDREVKEGIAVDTLKAVSADSVGLIGADKGGLPIDMWQGTPRPMIARLLDLTGAAPATSGLRDLVKRLLLSQAAIPEENGPAAGQIVLKRAEALDRMGEWQAFSDLLDLLPRGGPGNSNGSIPDARIARMKADAGFLAGRNAQSCAIVEQVVPVLPDDRYWQKAGVFCHALAGRWDNVEFGIRLLVEVGDDDKLFVDLMRAVSGTLGEAPSWPEPTRLRPLDLAMMRAGKVAPRIDDPAGVPPALIAPLVALDQLAFETRLALAERGEALGLLDRAALVRLYDRIEVAPAQMANALTVATADPGANGRALLFRATAAQTVDLARAQAIKQALALARKGGRFAQAARLYAPMILAIPTTSPYAWFAADAAEAFAAAGMTDAAQPWLALAEREALRDPASAAGWREAAIVARLAAGERVPLEQSVIEAWWQGQQAIAADRAPHQAVLLFGLLKALGAETPDTVWRGLLASAAPTPAAVPPAGLSYALDAAVAGRRIGEGTMLAVLGLSGTRLSDVSAVHALRTVAALAALGLEAEARRLAVDIYLAGREPREAGAE